MIIEKDKIKELLKNKIDEGEVIFHPPDGGLVFHAGRVINRM